MTEGLGDFFKLIAEDKKKKKDEFDDLVGGDLGLDSLFSELGAEKKRIREEKEKITAKLVEEEKKKKEEFDKIVGDIDMSSLFGELSKAKKEVREQKIENDERQKQVLNSLESFLTAKIDDIEEIKEEIVAEPEVEEVVEEIVGNRKESLMEKSLGLLSGPSENIPGAEQNFATLDDLQKHYKEFLVKIQQQLSTLGGGGIEDAPKTGGPYVEQGQKWVVSGGTGIGSTSILYDGSTVRVEATDYGALTTGISSATNVSLCKHLYLSRVYHWRYGSKSNQVSGWI